MNEQILNIAQTMMIRGSSLLAIHVGEGLCPSRNLRRAIIKEVQSICVFVPFVGGVEPLPYKRENVHKPKTFVQFFRFAHLEKDNLN